MSVPSNQEWDRDVLGNHRVVISVVRPADAVRVRIPWRRRDRELGATGFVVIAEVTGEPIPNAVRLASTREEGIFAFEPAAGTGRYFLYFMPYTGTLTSPYPTIEYSRDVPHPDDAWLCRAGLVAGAPAVPHRLPWADVVGMESIDAFHAFTPMEQIATEQEVAGLRAHHPDAPCLLFAEDRRDPIRMTHDLPFRWIERGPEQTLHGDACRGEFYVFQVGLYAVKGDLHQVQVVFSDFVSGAGKAIAASACRCFNAGGIGWDGAPSARSLQVPAGTVQALWCGIAIPADLPPGSYRGTVQVSADGAAPRAVTCCLAISLKLLADHGDDEPWRLSRLRWLDSTAGTEDTVVRPFLPMARTGPNLSILGRRITLSDAGLPAEIVSTFSPAMTAVGSDSTPVLAAPIRFRVEDAAGSIRDVSGSGVTFREVSPVRAGWSALARAGDLNLSVEGVLEFDGNMELRVEVRSRREVVLRDIRLEIPFDAGAAGYMMGLGRPGGVCPESYSWKWDVGRNQDAFWLGAVNAGLQVTLKDEHYSRPLNTNFYRQKPLVLPRSWHNDGRGGVEIQPVIGAVRVVSCYSGPRELVPGDTLHFHVRLLVTPFKPLDPTAHLATRFHHAPTPVDEVVATGANTINLHHGNQLNPYINYPFLSSDRLGPYIREAHRKGCRVKLYYTVRELTTHAPEIFALMSLGDEILVNGPGGGHAWLREHLEPHYLPAWYTHATRDTSVINGVLSRWHNFYVEGMDWLAHNLGIDGVYLDDLGFGREIMQRVRRVLERHHPQPVIDLHSANQYNERDGFASSANLYLEHFPYLDRLWFGEYFDYDARPDYWLVEMSGIPFGLMGEMLQDGGNPWRGMVFGMTARRPMVPAVRDLWEFWDEVGLTGSEMIGWWTPDCPVATGNADILATVFATRKAVVIALASWASAAVEVRLAVDGVALGMNADSRQARAPAIAGFQESRTFPLAEGIPLEPGKGWLLVLENG